MDPRAVLRGGARSDMPKIDEVLVVGHTHHDVGYTNVPALITRMHECAVYKTIELCEQDEPADERAAFRWTLEISRPVVHFLRHAADKDITRFQAQVAAGRISLSAAYMHMTQLIGHEDYVRYFMPVREIREHGLPVSVVQHGDVNGLSWGVVPLMREAG